MAALPRPVAGYMAGVVSGLLFIIGGSYWEDKQQHRTDLVQVFDPATNIWSRSTALPTSRSDAASATLGADIYCFGGVVDEEARSDAVVFHHSKWTTVPDATFPEPR